MTSQKKTCPKCKRRNLVRNGGYGRRWVCIGPRPDRAVCYSTTNPDAPYRGQDGRAKEADRNPQFKVRTAQQKVFVITWAQNATPVHKGFLASLLTFCRHRDAQLIVVPGRYKNPTSQWTESQEGAEYWAEEVRPYLHNQRTALNKSLVLAADVKTQPTATSPTTGFEALTHGESCILGHPKVQLRTIPSPQNTLPKIVTTTGAITAPNYTDTRAGKIGAFHHAYGAVIVEVETSKRFHLRHINADDRGEFIDLEWHYQGERRRKAAPYLGLVFGDAHYRFADPAVVKATFGPGGMVERLNPEKLVWHDLLDAYAVTPHHERNPFIKLAKHRAALSDARREVEETVEWLRKLTGERESFVVASNHDDMLARWLMNADWRLDPENAEFYLETALHVARSAKVGAGGAEYLDAFQFWLERLKGDSNVTVLRRGESLTIGGAECGLHGDSGPNGSRGTVRNLRRLGVRVISGHGHSPAIEEGHYRTGTMTRLKLEYTHGPGSWLNTHCAVDALNKRHLLNVIDGRFTTMD